MQSDDYNQLVAEWANLRDVAASAGFEDALHLINDWWATAPLSTATRHNRDTAGWPTPWELLQQPAFCDLSICIGIVQTILLSHPDAVESLLIVQTLDYTSVLVNNQYVLHDQPGEINSVIDSADIQYQIECIDLLAGNV